MVANFFQNLGDYGSAITFLVMSGCTTDALVMAQQSNKMDVYASVVGESASDDDYVNIASHFEKKGDWFEAGKFALKANDYTKVRLTTE